LATYIYVKRNTKHPYSYPDEDAPFTQFKKVKMGVAFNMVNSRVGWERAKREDYEHWRQLIRNIKRQQL